MPIFNITGKNKEKSSYELEDNIDKELYKKKTSKNKRKSKKKRIGFKLPKINKQKKVEKKAKSVNEKEIKTSDNPDKKIIEESTNEGQINLLKKNKDEEDKTLFSKKTKSSLLNQDKTGKPVYLEDTGEKLGVVYKPIIDRDDRIAGYKIKDNKSEAVLSFPLDQFIEDKNGLIFVPSWYTKALKTVEKLEFKDRISPELTVLLSDDRKSNKDLYEIFVKHDNEMADYIEKALSLKNMLSNHLHILEKKRVGLKDDLMDLTEKRLIKDIDRREFAEDVMKHRKKVNILDVNIQKCRNLLKRLNDTSFGVIGENLFEKEKTDEESLFFENKKISDAFDKNVNIEEDLQPPYKEKYYELKDEFEQLEGRYKELKTSVEKLFNKENL